MEETNPLASTPLVPTLHNPNSLPLRSSQVAARSSI
jgi:hypothetical protein